VLLVATLEFSTASPLKPKFLLIILLAVCIQSHSQSQSDSSFRNGNEENITGIGLFNNIEQIPEKIFDAINKKASLLEKRLDRQTDKYLSKLERRENKLRKKLWKKDSTLAKQLFDGPEIKYNKLKSLTGKLNKYQAVYSGHLDSL